MKNFPTNLLPSWEGRVILSGLRGSHLFGTNIEGSDKDYFAVWSHPPSFYYGLRALTDSPRRLREEQHQAQEDGQDLLTIDLPKFVQHLTHNNPTYHTFLWGDDLKATPAGSVLIANREKMVGTPLVRAFWETGSNLFIHKELVRSLTMLWSAASLRTTGKIVPNQIPFGAAIRYAKRNEHYYFLEAICNRLFDKHDPTIRDITKPGPTYQDYEQMLQLAMAHEWNLTLNGVQIESFNGPTQRHRGDQVTDPDSPGL